jgi:hypothetical protein
MNTEFTLMLYPVDSGLMVDLAALKGHLDNLGLLGEPLCELGLNPNRLGDNHYAVGANFLSLFTFMGCSPVIELQPQADKPFCYMGLDSDTKPRFVSGSNLKKSRCTQCKNELQNVSKSLSCSHCKKPLQLDKINWRKTAFLAKTWITIGNIYELEAIPNDELLDSLKHLTGVQWKPAYIRNATYRDLN